MLERKQYPHIFTPLKLGPITLKNRLGFAPMVCNQCTIDGTVTDAMVEFVTMQARCGVGYVTIGDTQVDDELGGAFMATMNIARSTSVPGMIRLQEAARYNGALLSVELNHSGRGAKDHLISGAAIAPSAVCFPRCSQNVRPMDEADLIRVREQFVNAARHAVEAGFPMVMVHAAHNNLLGQFLSPLSNQRTDAYGGTAENRRRYPLEVIRAVREAVGDGVAIELRVSATEMTPGGLELEESLQFIEAAQEYVDLIHVSRGIVYNDAGIYTLPTFLREPMLNVDYARKVKERVTKPVATVGNFSTLDQIEQVLANGWVDVVCMARAFLSDNKMVEKCLAHRQEDIRPCLRCHRGCIDNSARGKAIHCSINPSLGFEQDIRALPTPTGSRKVLVAGGGPAGITAATTLVSRGHQVILCEQSSRLGGLLQDAAAPGCKTYMKEYLKWLVHSAETSGAEIRLNTTVTSELVEELSPDAVIVATGSTYLRPNIPGIDRPNVVMLHDAEHERSLLGKRILVCGGGSAGLECALSLSREGYQVAVADQLPKEQFASGMPYFPRLDLMQCLETEGVTLLPRHRISSFTEEGALLSCDGIETHFTADTCIIALGVKHRRELIDQLNSRYAQGIIPVGDCEGGTNIYDATHTGYFGALTVL